MLPQHSDAPRTGSSYEAQVLCRCSLFGTKHQFGRRRQPERALAQHPMVFLAEGLHGYVHSARCMGQIPCSHVLLLYPWPFSEQAVYSYQPGECVFIRFCSCRNFFTMIAQLCAQISSLLRCKFFIQVVNYESTCKLEEFLELSAQVRLCSACIHDFMNSRCVHAVIGSGSSRRRLHRGCRSALAVFRSEHTRALRAVLSSPGYLSFIACSFARYDSII